MDYRQYLNANTKRRTENMTVHMRKLLLEMPDTVEVIFMATGMPNTRTFAFDEIVFQTRYGFDCAITGKLMNAVTQYGNCNGFQRLREQFAEILCTLHQPIGWSIDNSASNFNKLIITSGRQESLFCLVNLIMEENMPILVTEPTDPNLIAQLSLYNAQLLPVTTDSNGIVIDSLLKAIRPQNNNSPKVLYVYKEYSGAPSDINRKRLSEVYDIARRNNLLIIEDDPYCFLGLEMKKGKAESLLSMDVDGRVLRFDTLECVLTPGIKAACVTGHSFLLEQFENYRQGYIGHHSNVDQVVASKILDQWKFEGFLTHCHNLSLMYCGRKEYIKKQMSDILSDIEHCVISFDYGYNLYMEIPSIRDTTKLALDCAERDVFVVPGTDCFADKEKGCRFLRLSFSSLEDGAITEGVKILRDIILNEIKNK